jgi:hypothetical protein
VNLTKSFCFIDSSFCQIALDILLQTRAAFELDNGRSNAGFKSIQTGREERDLSPMVVNFRGDGTYPPALPIWEGGWSVDGYDGLPRERLG